MPDKAQTTFIVVAIGLIVLVGGLVSFQGDTEQEDKTLKVGAILPMSGPAGVFGEDARRGMEIAQKELKKDGVNIEVVYADSQASPEKGLTAYERLKNVEDVDVVYSMFSRVSVPLIEKAERDKTPLFMSLVAAKDVASKSDFAFRLHIQPEQQGEVPFGPIVNQESYDEVALLSIQDEYGTAVNSRIKENLRDRGIEVVADEWFEPGTGDVRTQLTKIKQSDPDALLFVEAVPGELFTIVNQVRELGIDADIIEASTVLPVESIREKLGDKANGIYSEAYPFTIAETGTEFREKFNEKHGKSPLYSAAYGYDLMKILGRATEGRSMSGEEIVRNVKALETHESLNGPVEIKESGEINPPLVPVQVVNGSLEKVE